MSAKISYGESEHSQSVQTYLRWLKGNPSRELKLIVKIALRHCRPPMQLEDLIAEGNLALLLAHQDYQIKKPSSPKNLYIYKKVRDHMLEYLKLNNMFYFPNHKREEVRDMDLLPSKDRDVVKQIEIKEEGKAFINAINRISSDEKKRQQNIFKRVYGIEHTFPISFEETGKEYNLGSERVKQITDNALLRLTWQLHNPLAFNPNHKKSKYSKSHYISLNGIRWALDSYYH